MLTYPQSMKRMVRILNILRGMFILKKCLVHTWIHNLSRFVIGRSIGNLGRLWFLKWKMFLMEIYLLDFSSFFFVFAKVNVKISPNIKKSSIFSKGLMINEKFVTRTVFLVNCIWKLAMWLWIYKVEIYKWW